MGKTKFLRSASHVSSATYTPRTISREKFVEVVDAAADKLIAENPRRPEAALPIAEELKALARTTDRAAFGTWSGRDGRERFSSDTPIEEQLCGCPIRQITEFVLPTGRPGPEYADQMNGFIGNYDSLMCAAMGIGQGIAHITD